MRTGSLAVGQINAMRFKSIHFPVTVIRAIFATIRWGDMDRRRVAVPTTDMFLVLLDLELELDNPVREFVFLTVPWFGQQF